MRKNFDEDRAERPRIATEEREFVIGGETFVHRTPDEIWPETTFPLDDLTPGIGEREALRVLDQLILDLVEPEGHERWKELRARRENPITTQDMSDLIAWLIPAVSGRPPTPQEPSSLTPESNGQNSTEISSLEQAEVSTS